MFFRDYRRRDVVELQSMTSWRAQGFDVIGDVVAHKSVKRRRKMKGGRGCTKGPEKDLTAGAAAADDDDDYDDDDDDEDAAGGDALETCLYGRWQVAHVTHHSTFTNTCSFVQCKIVTLLRVAPVKCFNAAACATPCACAPGGWSRAAECARQL